MNRKTRGILCILSAAFFFAAMNAFVRAAGDLPSIQKSFFRNLVAVCFAAIILVKNHVPPRVERKELPYLFMRAFCGTLGILCNFYAVDHLLLSDASVLNKLSPFFAIIFSYFLLKEKIKPAQAIAVVMAFIGALCVVKPGFQNADLFAAVIGVMGGLTAGAAYTFVRILGTHGVKGPVIVFWFSAFSCLVTLPYLIFQYTPMTGTQILCLLMAGLMAAGGQFSITAAYTYAPAKEISIYDYSQVIFSAIIGWIFFSQMPDALSVLGYVIICAAFVWMFLYQKKHEL